MGPAWGWGAGAKEKCGQPARQPAAHAGAGVLDGTPILGLHPPHRVLIAVPITRLLASMVQRDQPGGDEALAHQPGALRGAPARTETWVLGGTLATTYTLADELGLWVRGCCRRCGGRHLPPVTGAAGAGSGTGFSQPGGSWRRPSCALVLCACVAGGSRRPQGVRKPHARHLITKTAPALQSKGKKGDTGKEATNTKEASRKLLRRRRLARAGGRLARGR